MPDVVIPESHQGKDPSGSVPTPTGDVEAGLLDRVQQGLDALESGEPVPTQEPAPQEEETPEIEAEGGEPEAPDQDAPESDEDGGGEATPQEGLTLPPAFRRSLKAFEWSDEQIDAAFKQNPNTFLETAAKLHATRNAELANWSAIGRQALQTNQQPPAVPQVPAQQMPQPATPEPLADFDQTQVQPTQLPPEMQQAVAQVQTMQAQVQAEMEQLQQLRGEIFGRQMDEFFSADQMKPFNDFYGADFRSASDEQFANRDKVLEEAACLIKGSERVTGTAMPFERAFQIAHDSVSKDFQETAIRNDLKAKATKRQKSLSLKPSNAKTKKESSRPQTMEELEAKVARGLKETFG